MNHSTETASSRRTVRFLLGLARLSPKAVAGMLVSQLLAAALTTTLAPLFVSKLLTQIANGSASLHHSGWLLAGYAIALFLGDVIVVRITIALAYYAETKMQETIAKRILDNQTAKSLAFHANHMSGGIVSDTNKLIGAIERFWDTIIFTGTPIVGTVLFVSASLSFVYWQYALVLFALSVGIAVLIIRLQTAIAPVSRAVAEKSSAQTAYFADVIANMATVKAFAGGAHERTAYHQKTVAWRRALFKELRSVLAITASFGAMMTLMNVSAFLAAILATQYHLASIGTMYLVINYTLSVVAQLWTVSNITRNYLRIVGDAGPMIAMLDEPIELSDPAVPEPVRITRGAIALQHVVFRHDGSSDAIFDGLSPHIKPGEKVGLVGHSGSGKTTLTRLLLRFSDIQDGVIAIDGQNIAAIAQDDLRRAIAYVPQEPMLFHRSVRENIAYGNPEADQATIEGVAKLASAHEFIAQLPNGYDTLVGERGVKLSGGQRQRIAIARAMLKNAPILVLDEATSALDSESEVLIQDALWKLMEGRTAIVIAHRLSTIQKMDRIVVLDHGRIVEEGSHKELVGKKDGTYARLWAHQSGGFIED